ncbi:sugar porter family MFS transporter [Raoultella ornithinolytica]|jgi:SP family arabinose:H+ symporter-like MFS transporter|uniref:MFS transporter n=2 Tax=Raoultella ornithinolytica TaxID=54291 RepID=A0A225U5E1_RAOOR|nr:MULTISPECIES: sugar porter family MFS transporter [Raoultella]ALQ46845.1 Glucose/mannose:H+ symporter GlcP [Raoultella ornithinolytica]ASI60887.1 MFS transporter [Raoultella ornithinolytica]AXC30328.1 MFS transporter [Raoultella sp. X13]EKU8634301.1 sugar porter family MFS transporter [Raoultella ornithinolytica]ELH1433944.1 sugar porter family MFS transporter [Raoultella ornithinolytica]
MVSHAHVTAKNVWMRNVLLISIVTAVGGFLFGFDNGSISGSVGFLQNRFALDADGIGWVTSSIIIGCIVGVALAGPLSDAVGRKKVLLLTALIFIFGVLGEAMATTAEMLVWFRILVGVGIGVETTIAPLYIAEVSPAHIRGRLVSLNQLFNCVGNLAIFSIAAVIASHASEAWNVEHGWRIIFATGIAPAIVFLLLLIWVPESPRWLIRKGRDAQGLTILRKINPDETTAREQLAAIKSALLSDSPSRLRELFTPRLRKALVVGFCVALFQQITGINAIFYYAPEIFKTAGVDVSGAMSFTVLIGLVLVISTLVSMWIIDKVGRRSLLIFGSAGMAIALGCIGLLFRASETQTTLLLICILAYVAIFAVSYGTVAYVIIAEIFPIHVRGIAVSIATFALWGGNFLVSRYFPVLVENISAANTFFIFSGISIIALFFVLTKVPETKGKTLEEIETELHRK